MHELPTLLSDAAPLEISELLADKAYDSDAVRELLASLGIIATIQPKRNRREMPFYDRESYKARHAAENGFVDAKQFRGIATRYCKLMQMYEGLVMMVEWFLGTKATRRKPSKYSRVAELTKGGQLAFASL